MRDVGIIIWAVLLIVGVVGSIASKVRNLRTVQGATPKAAGGRIAAMRALRARGYTFEQARTATAAAPAALSQAPPQGAPPAPPPRARPPSPRVIPAEPVHGERQARKPHLRFPGRNELVRAVIGAEVLGKPRGLSDEYSPPH